MNLKVTILDESGNNIASVPICQIKNMDILHGLQTHRYALHSNLFETLKRYREFYEVQRNKGFSWNPFEGSSFTLEDAKLLMPYPTESFFYFYTYVDGIKKTGIINSKGQVLAYANFDDALAMSDEFVILKSNNLYGFANSRNQRFSSISFKSLDLQPTLSIDEQEATTKLAAIATLEINHQDLTGALDENGQILIPFIYHSIEYHVKSVTVRIFGDVATVDIKDLNPEVPITLHEKPCLYDDSDDPDPWGGNAEMDYIRNNGGDWIDD